MSLPLLSEEIGGAKVWKMGCYKAIPTHTAYAGPLYSVYREDECGEVLTEITGLMDEAFAIEYMKRRNAAEVELQTPCWAL